MSLCSCYSTDTLHPIKEQREGAQLPETELYFVNLFSLCTEEDRMVIINMKKKVYTFYLIYTTLNNGCQVITRLMWFLV